nr:hypothetical protein [Micromonospora sp. DSM 115978]
MMQTAASGRSAIAEPVDLVMREVDDAESQGAPTLRIPEEMARALLDALSAHFGGTSEVMTLRADYRAERDRVDRMINYLTSR